MSTGSSATGRWTVWPQKREISSKLRCLWHLSSCATCAYWGDGRPCSKSTKTSSRSTGPTSWCLLPWEVRIEPQVPSRLDLLITCEDTVSLGSQGGFPSKHVSWSGRIEWGNMTRKWNGCRIKPLAPAALSSLIFHSPVSLMRLDLQQDSHKAAKGFNWPVSIDVFLLIGFLFLSASAQRKEGTLHTEWPAVWILCTSQIGGVS